MIGTVVGTYRILRQIGEGGMGAVWLAEHTILGRRAAIKVLHPMFSTRPDIVTRFFNEARAATAISDPGIVQIYDFGHATDGSAYIVMELLEGEALDHRLRRLGRLPTPQSLLLMRQVASSLGAAHARGIVHRDLKPENIFLVRDPEVAGGERAKILDFGIAKLLGDHPTLKTQTSAVMGTPMYMSPEQCRGAGAVDQRSDVYALGCVLFALLTGRPPFDAEGAGEIIAMHLREPPPAPSMFAPYIAPEVDRLVLCCLAKDPAQRYESAAQLAAALDVLRASVSSPQLGTAPPPPPMRGAPTTLSSASGLVTAAPMKSRRTGWIAASVLVVGGGVIAVVAASSRGDTTASPPPAPVAATAPVVTPPPPRAAAPALTPEVQVAPTMRALLASFSAWATDHAGAPCPTVAELGAPIADPWGHPLALTCTDQPANQIAGALSLGPDGVAGTADDLASWQLGRDVTASMQGERWKVAAAKPTKRPKARPATPPAGMLLDENGMPVNR